MVRSLSGLDTATPVSTAAPLEPPGIGTRQSPGPTGDTGNKKRQPSRTGISHIRCKVNRLPHSGKRFDTSLHKRATADRPGHKTRQPHATIENNRAFDEHETHVKHETHDKYEAHDEHKTHVKYKDFNGYKDFDKYKEFDEHQILQALREQGKYPYVIG